jgi:hypothetical protein
MEFISYGQWLVDVKNERRAHMLYRPSMGAASSAAHLWVLLRTSI